VTHPRMSATRLNQSPVLTEMIEGQRRHEVPGERDGVGTCSVHGTSTLGRVACARCLRPQVTCLCALTKATAHRTEVLVLQHPQEQRQAKNSVALLRLSLAHCEVVVGERFSPGSLAALLQRPGWDTRLLYPDVPTAPASLALGQRRVRLCVCGHRCDVAQEPAHAPRAPDPGGASAAIAGRASADPLPRDSCGEAS